MYLAHHNGKKRREKIRVRTYEVSGISFLEVKNSQLPGGLYTKTVEYEDINYSVASTEDQHQLCGGPCGNFVFQLLEKKKLTRSEGPFERGKGLKETRSL